MTKDNIILFNPKAKRKKQGVMIQPPVQESVAYPGKVKAPISVPAHAYLTYVDCLLDKYLLGEVTVLANGFTTIVYYGLPCDKGICAHPDFAQAWNYMTQPDVAELLAWEHGIIIDIEDINVNYSELELAVL